MRIPFASPGYQLFMLALCTYAVLGLAVQAAVHVDPGAKTILDYADHAICALFFIDFIVNLVRAENRWKYFVTWGWMDLLSSIPMIDVARWGRAARILRIFRLVRGIRATKLLIELVVKQRRRNGLLAATLMALLLVIFSSIAVLHFETKAPDGNIKTPENALWWAWATITTVGYGDHYPLHQQGV